MKSAALNRVNLVFGSATDLDHWSVSLVSKIISGFNYDLSSE